MIFPFQTNVYIDREPRANLFLMMAMVFVHVVGWLTGSMPIQLFDLRQDNVVAGLFFVYFVHLDVFHLFGNLLFLWTFGNAVCSRLGSIGYVGAFFLVGMLSSIVHLLTSEASAVGASGAISGIVGMFLYLFSGNSVRCGWILLTRGGIVDVPAKYLIGFYFVLDFIGAVFGHSSVAYGAHIAGTLSGLLLAFILDKFGLIQRWQTDKSLFNA